MKIKRVEGKKVITCKENRRGKINNREKNCEI